MPAEARAATDLLNGPQREAVLHHEGPLIVFAGAGSGKTRVITHRIAELVQGYRVPPYEVLAVTFTNKAAGEMKSRLERMLGPELTRDLWVGTFHAVCARLLRRYGEAAGIAPNFTIYDATDQRALMTRVGRELGLEERRFPPQQLLARVLREKQEARGPESFLGDNYFDEVAKRAYVLYEKQLRAANAVDFEDLLLKVLAIAESETPEGEHLRGRFRQILVDEFQDVNTVQYRLVGALAPHHNVCAVGDDDQAIYRWRGADVRKIRGFVRDFPGARLVKLEQNYRSSGHIVAAALGVIGRSSERQPKELWTAEPAGEPGSVVATRDERDEAAWVVTRLRAELDAGTDAGHIAIFYRVHAQSRVLEEAMRAENLPYQIIGGHRFFDRAEVKDLIAYLRLIANPKSDVDLLRIINVPARKIGQKTVERLGEVARERGLSLYEALAPVCREDLVPTAAKKALGAFSELMDGLMRAAPTDTPHALAERVLADSGYEAALKNEDTAEADGRLENLREVLSSLADYEEEEHAAGEDATLEGYLARITLQSDADQIVDAPRVPMMTVHAAKGLEFDAVFLCGMEDRLFPLRSDDPNRRCDVEEERRLCYVALTRARHRLYVLHTAVRLIYGQTRYNAPSPFLGDLPRKVVREVLTDAHKDAVTAFAAGRSPYATAQSTGDDDEVGPSRLGGGFGGRAGASSFGRGSAARRSPSFSPRRVSEPPRAPGERYLEPEPDDGSSPTVRVGARVSHPHFGLGVVQKVDTGPDPIATVKFVGQTPKRIKLSFLSSA
ncbi:MAG: UvrD-helicase domain-containing protein [Myxococcales bacterium]|nr:UvrD-helicase domain-containing protein [Myxococcales bacterium]